MIQLNINFHQQTFMKQAEISLVSLLIIWITYKKHCQVRTPDKKIITCQWERERKLAVRQLIYPLLNSQVSLYQIIGEFGFHWLIVKKIRFE